MCQVYESACFTIMSASKDSHSSFLNSENEGQTVLQRQNKGKSSSKARMPLFLGIHTAVGQHKRDPLDSKAWPLQERLLSRRTMIFSVEGVQWECRAVRLVNALVSPWGLCVSCLVMNSTQHDARTCRPLSRTKWLVGWPRIDFKFRFKLSLRTLFR